MICPSCSESLTDRPEHCTHCGIAINHRSVQVAKMIGNFGWVARRSLGGYFAGAVGCTVAIAVARTMQFESASTDAFARMLDYFPGQIPVSTAVAGCFIGAVGGMIERSTYKCFLGGILGALGGMLGSLAYPHFKQIFTGYLYNYSFSMAGAWGITGAMLGLTSGILEGTKSKILAGTLGGLVGGMIGGGVGAQMYGAMLVEIHGRENLSWTIGRGLELASGGVVGVLQWFVLGIAEKLYIFKRRQLVEGSKKVCDHCHTENGLRAWYCAHCGAALQVAATRDQISVTPFRGLELISNAFQYMSWLAATTGVVLAVVVFMSFIAQNFIFAVFGSLLVALVIYIVAVIFKGLSDSIRMGIQVSEKLSKENVVR